MSKLFTVKHNNVHYVAARREEDGTLEIRISCLLPQLILRRGRSSSAEQPYIKDLRNIDFVALRENCEWSQVSSSHRLERRPKKNKFIAIKDISKLKVEHIAAGDANITLDAALQASMSDPNQWQIVEPDTRPLITFVIHGAPDGEYEVRLTNQIAWLVAERDKHQRMVEHFQYQIDIVEEMLL